MQHVAVDFLIIWCAYALYTFWKTKTSFPVKDVALKVGRTVVTLPVLPFDRYTVSFLIRHELVGGREMLETISDIEHRNSEHPIDFTVRISGLFGPVTTYRGSTKEWTVGGISTLHGQNLDYFHLYGRDRHLIKFLGMPFQRYKLELDTNQIGGVAAKYPVSIFVDGYRDNGYYPIGPIMVLIGSFILFGGLFIAITIVKIAILALTHS